MSEMRYEQTKREFIGQMKEVYCIQLSGRALSADELLERLSELFKPSPKPKKMWEGGDHFTTDKYARATTGKYARALLGGPSGRMTERDALMFIVSDMGYLRMSDEAFNYYLPAILRIVIEGDEGDADPEYEEFEGHAQQLLIPIVLRMSSIHAAAGLTRRQRLLIHDVVEFSMMRSFNAP